MRWTTRDTLDGGLSEAEEADRYRQWAEAKQAIRPLLTPGAEQLLDINTHDGVLDSLLQVESQIVELRALIGDNQEGIIGFIAVELALVPASGDQRVALYARQEHYGRGQVSPHP